MKYSINMDVEYIFIVIAYASTLSMDVSIRRGGIKGTKLYYLTNKNLGMAGT